MGASVYELAILLSLKDMASGGLDRVEARLRATGAAGKATLQNFQDLRANFKKGLAIAGVGVGMLTMMKKGIDEAGDYESALLDLRSAYQETAAAGASSAAEQEAQLKGLGNLAVDLGNKLQGNTKTYVGILTALKQAGLPGDQVMGGAGRSAAYLANVSGALARGQEREQAKELGQFGLMFKLRPEEFETSVNLFSALKDKFDIESGSLIESSKYFQATSNQLGITGAKGAGDTVKFFALLKRQAGMEGSMAGTGARSFFMQLATEEKKIAALKKATGIELKPFDEKGMFRGYEAMFSEMEKFRGLNQQQSAKWLNNIFGERGQEVAGAMVKVGLDGWKSITAESAKAVPVNEKITQQMATYNAKVEALTGSIQNLTASAFMPMLDTAKPLVDTLNTGAGALQGWAAAHPGLARVGGQLFGMTGVVVTLYGAVKMGTAAWGLYSIASNAAGVQLAGTAGKAGMLSRTLAGLGNIKTIGILVALTYAIVQGKEYYDAVMEFRRADKNAARAGTDSASSLSRLKEDYTKRGEQMPPSFYEKRAGEMMWSAKNQGAFSGVGADLAGGQRHLLNPYGLFYPEMNFVKQTPELADPGLMKAFLAKLEKSGLDPSQVEKSRKSLEAWFPESFKKALEENAKSAAELHRSFTDMATPVDRTRGIFTSLNFSLLGFQSRLNNWTPAAIGASPALQNFQFKPEPAITVPTFKFGKTSLVSQAGRSITINGGLSVNVPAGSRAADDPEEFMRMVEHQAEIQSERA